MIEFKKINMIFIGKKRLTMAYNLKNTSANHKNIHSLDNWTVGSNHFTCVLNPIQIQFTNSFPNSKRK